MLNRRGLLSGIFAASLAPVFVPSSSLMKVVVPKLALPLSHTRTLEENLSNDNDKVVMTTICELLGNKDFWSIRVNKKVVDNIANTDYKNHLKNSLKSILTTHDRDFREYGGVRLFNIEGYVPDMVL